MKKETEAILQDLEKLDWFHSVGEPLKGAVAAARNWNEAAKYERANVWQCIKLRWQNELSEWLCIHHRQRFQMWNDIIAELNPRLSPIVDRSVESVVADATVTKVVRDTVDWDIGSLLIESEYSDLREPKYYAALGLVYFDGHFPCGWDAKHSNGRMIVY